LLYFSFTSEISGALCLNKFKRNFSFFAALLSVVADAPYKNQLTFQDPATSVMNAMIDLHHDIMAVLIFIIIFVLWFLTQIVVIFHKSDGADLQDSEADGLFRHNITHNVYLEYVWTLVPAAILVMIAIPSFVLLYNSNEPSDNPAITFKVIGHQWY